MKRIAIVIVVLNLLLLDALVITGDRYLRTERDWVCDSRDSQAHGASIYAIVSGQYDLVQLTAAGGRRRLHFYGCDASGHRYRVWVEQN